MSTCRYPVLDADALYQALCEVGVRVPDITVLSKPTPDGVKIIFEQVINAVWGNNVPNMMFFSKVRYLMTVARVEDFDITDLGNKPDGERFRMQLSGLVNFLYYTQDLQEESALTKAQIEAADVQLADLKDEGAQLEQDYETALGVSKAKQNIVLELRANNAVMRADLESQKAVIKDLTGKLAATQEELAVAEQETSMIQAHSDKIREEIAILRNQLVTDPVTVQEELAHNEAQLAKLDKTVRELNADVTSARDLLQRLLKVHKNTADSDAEFGTLEEFVQQERELKQLTDKLQADKAKMVKAIDMLRVCKHDFQSVVPNATERLLVQKEKVRIQMEELDERIRMIQLQSPGRDATFKKQRNQLMVLQQQMADLHRKEEDMLQAHHAQLQLLEEELAQSRNAYFDYERKLKARMLNAAAASRRYTTVLKTVLSEREREITSELSESSSDMSCDSHCDANGNRLLREGKSATFESVYSP